MRSTLSRNLLAKPMAGLVRQWEQPKSRFGDLVVIGFLLMQCLDAVFTYLGVALWGPSIEANPLISSAMSAAGVVGALGDGKRGRDWLRHPAPPAAGAHSCRRFNGHLLCARDSPLDDFILLHESVAGPSGPASGTTGRAACGPAQGRHSGYDLSATRSDSRIG